MEIKYIFKLILKWLWLIVLIPVLAGAGAYFVSVYVTAHVYEATTTMYIVNSMGDPAARITAVYGDITSAQNAVENYGEIIKSKSVINEALEKLNLKGVYSAGRFSENIQLVLPTRDSFLLAITVKDVNPKLAADMANKLSEILVERTDQYMKIAVLKILDRAEVPAEPSNDNTMKNVGLAILAGMIFSGVIIFFVEYTESVIIKDKKDVLNYLEIPVLAVIPSIKMQKPLDRLYV